jgi:hypothetical protein
MNSKIVKSSIASAALVTEPNAITIFTVSSLHSSSNTLHTASESLTVLYGVRIAARKGKSSADTCALLSFKTLEKSVKSGEFNTILKKTSYVS